jgi:hypothetical protein
MDAAFSDDMLADAEVGTITLSASSSTSSISLKMR